MKRVLYFTGYRMVAQEWNGHKLESSVYFEPDAQGLDLFSAYLSSFSSEPVRLLVDLIEEEFRQVKIPLLRGSDRSSILQRNFTKYFRNSEYRFAITQSVQKKKRKEEHLLLIGLTNQYLLEPWLEVMSATKTPLSGIISLPLMSQNYVASLKSECKAIILVSQQVPSNLRQSVFINGKLILSRLVPIASFYQGDYASDVLRDIESTQRYLISQRIVERSDPVEVHMLTNMRHLEKMRGKTAENTYFDFHLHEINELLKDEKIEIAEEQDFSSGLFCYLASKPYSLNHYANAKEKKYYRHHLVALGLKTVSSLLVAAGIGVMATNLVKSTVYDNTIEEMSLIEQKYQSKYNQLSENRVGSTTSTISMQHIVQTVADIKSNHLTDPENMLSMISRDISLFTDLRVKNLDWFVSNISDSEQADDVSWGKAARSKKQQKRQTDKRKTRPPQKGFFEIASVSGEFLNFSGNYRYALSVIDDLEKAMTESGKYFSVEITKRPLDVESDNSLSGDIGSKRSGQEMIAEFGFRVVREVAHDE